MEVEKPRVVIRTKSTGIAAILSLIIMGLGQIYVGKLKRGLALLFLGIILGVVNVVLFFGLFVVVGPAALAVPVILGIVSLIIWIWQIFDAYKLAKKYNEILIETGRPPW